MWALSSSDVLKGVIQSSYKQQRQEDDLNQPLSVQPWGSDSYRRRYYLIEGLYDTQFRVYREGNFKGFQHTWYSVAGSIEELKALAEKLQIKDGGQRARLLSSKILAAIPRFEASEEKRKRKEYRATRKQLFKRADPDYSIYEGRTRGKRIKYTFSDEEDVPSETFFSRRSARSNGPNSAIDTNAPTITQSGRQVRSRQGGLYGETIQNKASAPTVSLYHDSEGLRIEQNDEYLKDTAAAGRNGSLKDLDRVKDDQKANNDTGLTSEEDGLNERDYNEDETGVESEFDTPEECTDDDEDEEDLNDDPKKLIVKLPIQPPTPEDKSVTPQLSAEKELTEDNGRLTPKDEKIISGACSASNVEKISCSTELTGNCIAPSIVRESPPARNLAIPHSPLAC